MRPSRRAGLAAGLLVLGVAGGLAFVAAGRPEADPPAADPKAAAGDEAALRKALEAFVAAFNDNDAKKLTAQLTATAEYIDDDGSRVAGANAIGELLGKYFAANKGAKLQIAPEGARTVAPGVAVEDAEAVITVADKKTQSARRVTIVYARDAAGWKVASYREYPEEPQVVPVAERLKELEWLVGEWADEGGDALVTNSVRFAPDRAHLIREFAVTRDGAAVLKGTQWIGVDPLTGNIKGWSFDTAGGRSESTWVPSGESWVVRATGVTSDGDESGVTYLIKKLSKDRIEVKSVHKVVGNTVEADSTALMVRKAPAPKK
jgi:uncharacterized protein (TIGR02246 family)